MKELLKSKTILLFIAIMLGAIIINSPSNVLENSDTQESYISYNVK